MAKKKNGKAAAKAAAPKDPWQVEVGARIKQARLAAGLRQEDIAKPCDVSTQAVHYWEDGKSPMPSYAAFKIAELTGVDLNWLLAIKPRKSPSIELVRERTDVAIISWEDLKDIETARQTATRYFTAHHRTGQKSFALRVKDNSNADRLMKGDICVFDPDMPPEPGKFVLALVGANREPKIREYQEKDDHVVLAPANDKWKPDKIFRPSDGEIVATMREFSRAG